jgi:phytoene dehydrogenase-like protein
MQGAIQHIVVVGGGITGLAAAALCARRGHRVTLFERATGFGGRAGTSVAHGFSLNFGAHALYLGGAGAKVLRELGVIWSGRSPSSTSFIGLHRGTEHLLPTGLTSLVATGMLSFSAKIEAAQWFGRLSRIDVAPLARVPLDEWLGRCVADGALRDLLRALVRLSTFHNDSARMSTGAALTQLRVASAGVIYVDGGWRTLVDGVAFAAERAGVHLSTRSEVVAVETDAARVTGVRMHDGSQVLADKVILATPPATARQLVTRDQEQREPWEPIDEVRVATLDVALARLPRPSPLFILGVDAPLYFSVHSSWGRLAPPGGALVHCMKYLAPNDHDEAAAEAELEALLDRAQPGWRREVVIRRFLPRMIVTHAAVLAKRGGLAGRPAGAWPDVSGLLLAGDWIGPSGMLLDACLTSARTAANAATRSERDESVARGKGQGMLEPTATSNPPECALN